jgi:hypothetical protein
MMKSPARIFGSNVHKKYLGAMDEVLDMLVEGASAVASVNIATDDTVW